MAESLVLNSYAKVNLYLKVLKRRSDGYHDIETIFERINLCDKIILKSRPDGEIRIISSSSNIPKDCSNLAYRSAKLLQESQNVKMGVDIKIVKRIPVGAGLGGGSSNAATVLLGLNKLWRLRLNNKRLAALGSKIGSDVVFFIYNTPFALGKGRGQVIKPLNGLKNIRLWHILVTPKIHVSTAQIYKKWDDFNRIKNKKVGLTIPCSSVKILTSTLARFDLSSMTGLLLNSLEDITFSLYPKVKKVKNMLAQSGAELILMSGSGSSVFAIVSSKKKAELLRKKLLNFDIRKEVFVARTF
ncbi:MAG: 4-(cytidine 5'-diphospho)-2-C-methyl-D-erythritol kinase [Candidatus Omnitrophica bacterium]|nr:4-(cytidine 5'-diphospho)-2-C-methyl-D-erythritol kinase [Candidatus Omnitrophota bacterium]